METSPKTIQLGEWVLDVAGGRLVNDRDEIALEPKSAAVLVLLEQHRGQVVSQDAILNAVWPDTVVSSGALARIISKLRKALGDDAQSPRFIETLPKRGYRLLEQPAPPVSTPPEPSGSQTKTRRFPPRLLAAVGLLLIVTIAIVLIKRVSSEEAEADPMLRRADDFYYQYTRSDNESAMALYERIIAESPESAEATLGLANTLIQTVLRWPESLGEPAAESPDLTNALATNRFDSPRAQSTLQRAEALAQRAVRLDANNPVAQRTLGLVNASLGQFEAAHGAYQRAIDLDPRAWGALINQGELYGIEGLHQEALASFLKAHAAMTEAYDRETVRIRPWYPDIGHAVASKYALLGETENAEIWYRRVLDHTPFHIASTVDLARLLHKAGDRDKAETLCRNLITRVGAVPECDAFLANIERE